MLRDLKLKMLKAAELSGLLRTVGNSNWRRQRLLILGYHGIAMDDEHLWRSGLFIPPTLFRTRMEYLRESGCNILPLSEGLERLRRSELPERSVAITFDDGWHDFHHHAFPVLTEFQIPATVYLTTYYVNFNRPVFDTMVGYLLWKSRRQTFPFKCLREALSTAAPGVRHADDAIRSWVRRERFTSKQKDALLFELAGALDLDYASILRKRMLHLMNPAEVKEVAAAGIDIQMHTHRHGLSRRQDWFSREISENRKHIRQMCHRDATHFCYPGGNHLPWFANWLEDAGVKSATTSRPSLCSVRSDRYFLPRVLDSATLSPVEFAGWISGFADFLPLRLPSATGEPFLEDCPREPIVLRQPQAV